MLLFSVFFPKVADKLKNTIQLQQDLAQNLGNIELLSASVQQRATQLSIISFETAIQYKSQRQYLKYLVPVLLGFLGVALFIPQILTQGSTRVFQYTKDFKEPNPYIFTSSKIPSGLEEGASFELLIKVKPAPGFHTLPKQLYIIHDQGKFLLKFKKRDVFSYRFNQLQKIRLQSNFIRQGKN
jgi:hypothetical protein